MTSDQSRRLFTYKRYTSIRSATR